MDGTRLAPVFWDDLPVTAYKQQLTGGFPRACLGCARPVETRRNPVGIRVQTGFRRVSTGFFISSSIGLARLRFEWRAISLRMVSAIIVAAGKGTRMGANLDKLFLEVAGRPVVA